MNRIGSNCVCLVIWTGTLITISTASAQAPAKYALLVAVSNYEHATLNEPKPLQFPEADAKAVGRMLQDYGYTVDLLLGPQATQLAIRQKLDALSGKGNQQGVVVVGFWGRGHCFPNWNSQQQSMFCPFNTTMRPAKDYGGNIVRSAVTGEPVNEPDPAKLVSVDEVMSALDRSGAGNRVLLADTSADITSTETFGYGITGFDLPANTAALVTHCSPNRPFEYEPWGHGGFTKCLLDLLPQIVAKQDDVAAIAGRLEPAVAQAVSFASKGTVQQIIKPTINGAPQLLLVRSSDLPAEDNAPPPKPEDDAQRTFTSRATGMVFGLVPRGTFTIGATLDESTDRDDTKHPVTISRDFYLGKYEVTQEEFQRVMGFNPSFHTGSTKLPVEQISWFDAVWFCNQLSELDGRTAYYQISGVTKTGNSIESATVSIIPTGNGYRLPTEAEWEAACRAGTMLPFYFGGHITTEQVNYNGNRPLKFLAVKGTYRQKTVAVDEIGTPNKFGLVNMHGNVWEWCWDWKADYPTGNVTDPMGPSDGLYRVLRGGGFVSSADFCRSAHRSFNEPKYRAYSAGFRVALSR